MNCGSLGVTIVSVSALVPPLGILAIPLAYTLGMAVRAVLLALALAGRARRVGVAGGVASLGEAVG